MGRSNGEDLASDAALTVVTVRTDQISSFGDNPRTLPNEARAELKASIMARGQEGALTLTKMPGRDEYVLGAGGNTRLEVIQELHRETGDARFATVQAVVKPYRGHLDLLDAHHLENSARGALSFGELAVSCIRKFDLWADEERRAGREPSVKGFCRREKSVGISLDPGRYREYAFFAREVWPSIPFFRQHTRISRRTSIELRRLYTAAFSVWTERGAGTKEEFKATFRALLVRQDEHVAEGFKTIAADVMIEDEDLSVDWMKQDLTAEIDMALDDADLNSVQFWLSTAESRKPTEGVGTDDDDSDLNTTRAPTGPVPSRSVADQPASKPSTVAAPAQAGDANPGLFAHEEKAGQRSTEATGLPTDEFEQQPKMPATALATHGPTDAPVTVQTDDLLELRTQAYEIAHGLAERHRFSGLVNRSALGNGYFIADFHPGHHDEKLSRPVAAWYCLFEASEMGRMPRHQLAELLSDENAVRMAIENEIESGSMPFATQSRLLSPYTTCWTALEERDQRNVFRLLEIVTRLKTRVPDSNALWNPVADDVAA